MSNIYEPNQELRYHFKKADNMLYLEATITIPVDEHKTLTLAGDPQLDNEATIEFTVKASGKNTQNPYVTTIFIPIVRISNKDISNTQLKEKIDAHLRSLKSKTYKVNVKVKSSGITVGQKTSKISGDADIKTT
jgi:hypothetical protein